MLFDFPETRCALNEKKEVSGFSIKHSTVATQAVEECMLMANQVVAMTLKKHAPENSIFREHPEPDETQWESLIEDIQPYNFSFIPKTTQDLNRVFKLAAERNIQAAVGMSILRNLNQARYTTKSEGHFGLGFRHYTHFTSPIRRYPDLLVHRILKQIELGNKSPYLTEEVAEYAKHCSEQERKAEELERASQQLLRFLYYQKQLKNGNTGPYPALISKIISRGILVDFVESGQRALLSFSNLNEYFEVLKDGFMCRGRKTGRKFRIGEECSVDLLRVDEKNQLIDVCLAGKTKKKRKTKKSEKGRKKHSKKRA